MNYILSTEVLKLEDDDILANLGRVHGDTDRFSVRGMNLLLRTWLTLSPSIC